MFVRCFFCCFFFEGGVFLFVLWGWFCVFVCLFFNKDHINVCKYSKT